MKTRLVLSGRFLLTAVMVVCAAILGQYIWAYYTDAPWTRDGHVRADVVRLAPDVSGLVSEVLVNDNQNVRKGDMLFRIDTSRFEIAFRQTEAQVANTKAALDLARMDHDRYQKLAANEVVSLQKRQQAEATVKQAEAAYETALASRDVASLNLERASVRAPVNGIITNFSLRPGNYATAGSAIGALVDEDSFYVAGYFEETKLPRIHTGDPARIDVMGEPRSIFGRVVSIAGGIEDRERSDTVGFLANVAPTFAWVRLAQRIPVRIAIDDLPAGVHLIAGRTATVSVLSGNDR
ncbi:MAG: HlyD family secretion protein [Rhizobiaceae bacterium]|nr:HlyD family secretion protein [Rhizobiaceae bacterium]